VILAEQTDAAPGEAPLRWLLLTTRPALTPEAVVQAVQPIRHRAALDRSLAETFQNLRQRRAIYTWRKVSFLMERRQSHRCASTFSSGEVFFVVHDSATSAKEVNSDPRTMREEEEILQISRCALLTWRP
jgi:hypothetical protein